MRYDFKEYLNDPVMLVDICSLFLDEIVGRGESRTVYKTELLPGWVLKVDRENSWDNIKELNFWTAVKETPEVAKWFAPCKWASCYGHILMQKECTPINSKNEKYIPDLAPDIFDDIHRNNFGFIGKQFVCFDYAFSSKKALERIAAGGKIKMKPFKFTH